MLVVREGRGVGGNWLITKSISLPPDAAHGSVLSAHIASGRLHQHEHKHEFTEMCQQ